MKKNILLITATILVCLAHSFAIQAYVCLQPDFSLHQPAPAFLMKDLNGKTVSLADYKGKVLVIDFWASWCLPCHESFPAMQKAVSRYAGQTDVVFLFIDTREKSADPQKTALEDMQKNRYNFRVAIDERGKDGVQDRYYRQFGMLGIPTQFIIDKGGFIRYKLEGYDPRKTTDQAAGDLGKLIEAAKQAAP